MKVGLALSGGGVLGGAWMVGALAALASETGWDPATADVILGTSAGAMIGALVAAGTPPWFMVAHSAGEHFDGLVGPDGHPPSDADRSAGAVFHLDGGLPRLLPGSPQGALRAIRDPRGRSAVQLLAGWLPWGLISTEPLKQTVRRAVPEGWAGHPNLWVCAWDYDAGRRVVFGRRGEPAASLADAVAASCAIPGFYRPVRIGGRVYVDGGVKSGSNLDVLSGAGLDLVICLSPMTTRHRGLDRWPHERIAAAIRDEIGRQLGREAKRLRGEGTEVLILQPIAEDLKVMGINPMNTRRRHAVVETAARTVAEQLEAQSSRQLLKGLPKGAAHRVRRPAGAVADWPENVFPRARARSRGRRPT